MEGRGQNETRTYLMVSVRDWTTSPRFPLFLPGLLGGSTMFQPLVQAAAQSLLVAFAHGAIVLTIQVQFVPADLEWARPLSTTQTRSRLVNQQSQELNWLMARI